MQRDIASSRDTPHYTYLFQAVQIRGKSVVSSHVITVPTGTVIHHCSFIWSFSPEGRAVNCLSSAGQPLTLIQEWKQEASAQSAG